MAVSSEDMEALGQLAKQVVRDLCREVPVGPWRAKIPALRAALSRVPSRFRKYTVQELIDALAELERDGKIPSVVPVWNNEV